MDGKLPGEHELARWLSEGGLDNIDGLAAALAHMAPAGLSQLKVASDDEVLAAIAVLGLRGIKLRKVQAAFTTLRAGSALDEALSEDSLHEIMSPPPSSSRSSTSPPARPERPRSPTPLSPGVGASPTGSTHAAAAYAELRSPRAGSAFAELRSPRAGSAFAAAADVQPASESAELNSLAVLLSHNSGVASSNRDADAASAAAARAVAVAAVEAQRKQSSVEAEAVAMGAQELASACAATDVVL